MLIVVVRVCHGATTSPMHIGLDSSTMLLLRVVFNDTNLAKNLPSWQVFGNLDLSFHLASF